MFPIILIVLGAILLFGGIKGYKITDLLVGNITPRSNAGDGTQLPSSAPNMPIAKPRNVSIAPGASVEHEDPQLMADFYRFASDFQTVNFTVTSGDRAKQPSSSPYPIAPEGKSLHERFATGKGLDEAIDVVANGNPLGQVSSNSLLSRYGIHVPFSNDPVHTELLQYNA